MKNNNYYNKIKNILFVNLAAGALFSLLLINFSLDISLLAFPLAIIFSAIIFYYTLVKVIKERDGKSIVIARKLAEYYPYVLFV